MPTDALFLPRNLSTAWRIGHVIRHRKLDPHFEAPPNCWVEKSGVIGRGNQQPCCRPVINFLKENSHKALKLAHIGRIVPAFRDRVELIQEQNAIDAFRIIQNVTHIGAGPSKKAAHDRREIKRQERAMQLAGNPASGQSLSHSRGACKNDRAGWR